MPYVNGKRVTLAEWRAAHPQGPLYVHDADGNRTMVSEGDEGWTPPDNDPRTVGQHPAEAITVNERSTRQDRSRRVVIANALGVAPDELPEDVSTVVPRDWGGHISLDPATGRYPWEEEPEDAAPEPEERPVAARKPSSEGDDTLNRRTERQAREYSALKGLPEHRKDRPSQTPGGRHARYVRAEAAKRGISPEAYDESMTHTAATWAACPYRNPS